MHVDPGPYFMFGRLFRAKHYKQLGKMWRRESKGFKHRLDTRRERQLRERRVWGWAGRGNEQRAW